MSERVARLRIRSIRMKNGGATVRILQHDNHQDAISVREWVDDCIMAQNDDIAGFAFVIWGKDGGSTCAVKTNSRSRIPGILVPEFVKSRLSAEQILDWARGK